MEKEDITIFTKAVNKQFTKMTKGKLYRVDIDKQGLWELYLKSFPEGTNPIYKERTEHDCNCCKNFIRDVGNVVAIDPEGNLITIWDTEIPTFYNDISKIMADKVRSGKIVNEFTHREPRAGNEKTTQQLENKSIKTWNHFYTAIPSTYVNITPEKLNESRTTVQVFQRGMEELTLDSADVVLELIAQNSIYRGAEFKDVLSKFRALKLKYAKLNEAQKNTFLWQNFNDHGARIKNTAIGTLLEDLSLDEDLEKAVKSFEAKLNPGNYKRPTALVSKSMIENAMKTIEELGIEPALYRRFAVPEDISVNNVFFANRDTSILMKDSLKDTLMGTVKDGGDYSKVEEIDIETFMKDVLPKAQEIEVKVENRHIGNLMSLIAPKNPEAPKIMKWNNNFSWSYNGNVTDSIKERVKNAGGNVGGVLRVSLSWFNGDDLDLHVFEPGGNHIYFGNKMMVHPSSGRLDVDMNAGGAHSRTPVENVTWTDKRRMKTGKHRVVVNQYSKREASDVGFTVEVECNGQIDHYTYQKAVGNGANITVIEFNWDGDKMTDLVIGKDIISEAAAKEVWGITTEKFHKVKLMTVSPNHWDGQGIGNKHYFFILDKCVNDTPPRGIYNEFISGNLDKHRKVFEMIGEKTKCEMTENQLSGIGMSSTQKNTLLCKVKGSFNRTLKIKF